MSAYSELKDKILDINKDADSAIDDLNFYGDDDDDDNFDAKSQKRKKNKDFAQMLQLERVEEEEDDISMMIESGKGRSHEASKKYMFD